MLSRVQLFATPWTVAHQAPLSMGFPRQEYWSGLPWPSPGDLPHPGIKAISHALAGGFFTTEPAGKPNTYLVVLLKNIKAIKKEERKKVKGRTEEGGKEREKKKKKEGKTKDFTERLKKTDNQVKEGF